MLARLHSLSVGEWMRTKYVCSPSMWCSKLQSVWSVRTSFYITVFTITHARKVSKALQESAIGGRFGWQLNVYVRSNRGCTCAKILIVWSVRVICDPCVMITIDYWLLKGWCICQTLPDVGYIQLVLYWERNSTFSLLLSCMWNLTSRVQNTQGCEKD